MFEPNFKYEYVEEYTIWVRLAFFANKSSPANGKITKIVIKAIATTPKNEDDEIIAILPFLDSLFFESFLAFLSFLGFIGSSSSSSSTSSISSSRISSSMISSSNS